GYPRAVAPRAGTPRSTGVSRPLLLVESPPQHRLARVLTTRGARCGQRAPAQGNRDARARRVAAALGPQYARPVVWRPATARGDRTRTGDASRDRHLR